jgi:serine/threonine protein kinase
MLAGKYRVERVLGAGGMGVVVAARHVELDQLVAIKFVRDEAIASEDAVQRFLREARAAVKLRSEHVARVLDVGKLDSGAPYMVMEFLEGSDLGNVLSERGPLPLDAAADWILQACEAVAEAHAAGIVHRDLKPENLFLARTVGGGQKIKVLDFGVSKAIGGAGSEMSGLTRTRAMLGSPLYMAPEQMRSSRDVDARADVWALGVVLFQLLTQRWPFEAETMPELCLKVVTEPPMSLAAIRPDIPAGIGAVIERCLDKDPKRRFANAAELASGLEPFVQPGSRVLADRARLAMGAGSGALSAPKVALAQSTPTLQSGSSGSTPGTSAPWGTERVVTPPPQPSPRASSGALRVVVGAALVGLAALAGFLFLGRGPASVESARPEAPIAAAPSLPATAAATPPTALVPIDRPTAQAAPSTTAADPVPAAAPSASASAAPRSASSPAANVAAVGKTRAAVAPRPPPGKSAATDDDIPTIR